MLIKVNYVHLNLYYVNPGQHLSLYHALLSLNLVTIKKKKTNKYSYKKMRNKVSLSNSENARRHSTHTHTLANQSVKQTLHILSARY